MNERTGTPVRTTITTGVVIARWPLLLPLEELANLVNIGTLFAFIVVAIGVVILRRTRPTSSGRSAPRGCRSCRSCRCSRRST